MVLLWNKVMPWVFTFPLLHAARPFALSHIHISTEHPTPQSHQPSLKASLERTRDEKIRHGKAGKISFYTNPDLGQNVKQLQILFTSLQATNGSVNIMAGVAVTSPFVADILNSYQYQLSVLLSDILQMFKVSWRPLGGFKDQVFVQPWNQWHRAKWREVRVPFYCDLGDIALFHLEPQLQRCRAMRSVQRQGCGSYRSR